MIEKFSDCKCVMTKEDQHDREISDIGVVKLRQILDKFPYEEKCKLILLGMNSEKFQQVFQIL